MVTKDVPPYAIVAGNPGKIIKYRYSKNIIHKIEEIAWWDWPIEKIKENFNLLLSHNVEEFNKVYGK